MSGLFLLNKTCFVSLIVHDVQGHRIHEEYIVSCYLLQWLSLLRFASMSYVKNILRQSSFRKWFKEYFQEHMISDHEMGPLCLNNTRIQCQLSYYGSIMSWLHKNASLVIMQSVHYVGFIQEYFYHAMGPLCQVYKRIRCH